MKNENQNYTQEGPKAETYGYRMYNAVKAQDLCKNCGKRKIDRSRIPNSVLCEECRKKLTRLKVPPLIWIVIVLVIASLIFIMKPAARGMEDLKTYNHAQQSAEEGYVITAIGDLFTLVERNPHSLDVMIELTEMATEYAYYDYAAYVINYILPEGNFSDTELNNGGKGYRLQRCIDEMNVYYDTWELIDEINREIFVGAEEDLYAMRDSYVQRLSQYIGNEDYDQALLYYSLGCGAMDYEKEASYFMKCIEINPNYSDALAWLANYYFAKGDFQEGKKILEEAYERNKENYSILLSYANFQLAKGDPEEGLVLASRVYGMYPDEDYALDTYIAALAVNGRAEEAETLVSKFEDQGYLFEQKLLDLVEGKMLLEDYYAGE